jgi:hypothetical protein
MTFRVPTTSIGMHERLHFDVQQKYFFGGESGYLIGQGGEEVVQCDPRIARRATDLFLGERCDWVRGDPMKECM